MAITVPVQLEVFEVRETPVKVEYSIDVYRGNVFAPETEAMIYSVNGVPANFFEDSILEEIDMEIKSHKAKIGKYSDSQCGQDVYLSNQNE
jgi:hypothetical protein